MNKKLVNEFVNSEEMIVRDTMNQNYLEVVPNSVESVNISSDYSALLNDGDLSDISIEIPFQAPIIVRREDLFEKNEIDELAHDTSDMVIETPTFEPLIISTYSVNKSMDSTQENGDKSIDIRTTSLDMSLEPSNDNNPIIIEHHKDTTIDNPKIMSNQPDTCLTPVKHYESPDTSIASPDIFNGDIPEKSNYLQLHNTRLIVPQYQNKEQYVVPLDRDLLESLKLGLSGVPPPYNLTVNRMSLSDMLLKLKLNGNYFGCNNDVEEKNNNKTKDNDKKSLILNIKSEEEVLNSKWPDILHYRYHGLHYNRGKVSEEIENLCDKYQKRFIGAETQSSCIFNETIKSSPKRNKAFISKWSSKSPGKRLSHLARRKITFSGANSHIAGPLAGSRARQILVDARKMLRLSPKKSPRKTPTKSPRLKPRTPSSSAKKKLAMRFRQIKGENTRRALFSSPKKSSPMKIIKSPFKQISKIGGGGGVDRKRKRTDWDESLHAAKFPRSMSVDVPSSSYANKSFPRTQSELLVPSNKLKSSQELTDVQRKKLQWAVYDALQSTNTTREHSQWKVYAAILGKVVKYFYLSQTATNIAKGVTSEYGTTERMSRIARIHVFGVIKGKSADEIVSEYLKSKQKLFKPQGYIAPDDYDKISSSGKENLFMNTEITENKGRSTITKPFLENRIDRIKKVINF